MGPTTDAGTEPIVTTAEVLANPGKYDGTPDDCFKWPVGGLPLLQALFSSVTAEGQPLYVPPTFGEWLRVDPNAALTYCLVVKRGRLNMAALSAKQIAFLMAK